MKRFASLVIVVLSLTALSASSTDKNTSKIQFKSWWNLPDTLTWTSFNPPSTRCNQTSGAYINGKYYQICGRWTDGYTYFTYPRSQIWDGASWTLSTAQHPGGGIYGHDCCVLNGQIIVGGGLLQSGEHYDYTSVYNPIADTWIQDTPMYPHGASYGYVMAACSGKAYIMGGFLSAFGGTFCWSPGDSAMTQRSSMTQPAIPACAASCNDRIYVFSGMSGAGQLRIIQEYTPATDTWVIKDAELPYNITSSVAVTIANKIYILGGLNGGASSMVQVYVYDPTQDTVVETTPMPFALGCHAGAGGMVGDNAVIYISGGDYSLTPTYAFRGDVTEIQTRIQPTSLGVMKAAYR